MKVFLQKPSGEDPVELEIDAHSSIADLERAIQDCDPQLENAFVAVVLGERILRDTAVRKSLADHGVTDGCSLTLIRHAIPTTLTASLDKTAKIWNSTTGECTQTFSGHRGSILKPWEVPGATEWAYLEADASFLVFLCVQRD